MKRLLHLCSLVLVLAGAGCEGGTSTPSGNPSTDTSGTPTSGQPAGSRPWDANSNLINPNGFDVLADPLDEILFPFSPGYLKTQGISRIEVRSYADSENPDMVEDASEQDMILSRRRLFAFDDQGQYKDVLDERFLGDPTPATSTHLAWQYAGTGQLAAIEVETKAGTSKTGYRRSYNFDPKGRLTSMETGAPRSTFYLYDEAQSLTYITNPEVKAGISVVVVGGKGALGKDRCEELQAEINGGSSPFVNYPSKGRAPESITFQERDGRETVREVHMGTKPGRVEYEILRKYNPDHNLAERKKQWDVPDADFKTFTQYRYAPNGDLIEVLHQQQAFNKPVTNRIDRYAYGADGLLTRRVRTERSGQDAEQLVLIEYYVLTKGNGAAKSADVQPGGANP